MFGFFERGINPFPPEDAGKPPDTVYAFCRFYTKGLEPWLILMALLTAILAVAEALLFGVLGKVVDWLALSDPETFLEQSWLSLVAMTVFLLGLFPVLTAAHSLVLQQTLYGNFPMRVRWMMHRYLLKQSYAYFQNEFSGRIATKVMQTALAVREVVIKVLDVMIFVVVYLVTTMTLIAGADPILCLPLLGWIVLYGILQHHFIPQLRRISTRQADARSLMTGRIVDSYTNILTLKLFSNGGRESDYARQAMGEFLGTVHPQMRLVTALTVSLWTLNVLLIFSTTTLGINLWLQGAITPGAIAIVLSLAIRLTGMSHWIMWEFGNLFENIGVVQDGINSVSVEQTVVDEPDAKELQVKRGEIEFRNVGFSYRNPSNRDKKEVFNGLDLCIEAGEKVGIVGRSGAGKSSLVSLLMRFYDIQEGNIFIDGNNIAGAKQESLRKNIAFVTQDTSLLHRSVRENILFGKPDASESEMLEAAEQAQANEFILGLKDVAGRVGYDAHVGERGVTLSGGQRQRIAIARVILKDAPILVLDEATSALDSEVEASIQENLGRLMRGKTVIAIAHRLSTISALDRLIVLDKGQIVEQGTHKHLIAMEGIYAQLWNHQSGGFLGFE
ncbi:MAG: multidrug ABC transporter ATP-binding protein [Porticoccaceae bacterium]|nr:multidrug ABC transporter ATP-binding protein [Porticoccaceae bacterium]